MQGAKRGPFGGVLATPLATLLISCGAMLGAPAAYADQGLSSNWAGYAVHGRSFHSVTGSWRQPAVSCTSNQDGYSAYWIGLGGYTQSSQALEQIGTEADCTSGGGQVLSAWYEMVPADSVPIEMTVNAGDTIDAQVIVNGHKATLWLRDRTTHQSFRKVVGSSLIDVSSAEWIVEAPSDCTDSCTTLPLADFTSAPFFSSRAETVKGHWGSIADPSWKATAITLAPGGQKFVANAGSGVASPSVLAARGSSFTVTYAQPPTAVTTARATRARATLSLRHLRHFARLGAG